MYPDYKVRGTAQGQLAFVHVSIKESAQISELNQFLMQLCWDAKELKGLHMIGVLWPWKDTALSPQP